MNKKQNLRKYADEMWRYACIKRWGNNCEVCGKIGQDVHHFFPRSLFGILRFNVDNGIILCRGCHFEHHFKANPTIHQKIMEKRGKLWYKGLEKITKEKHRSFQTIKYYNDTIKELEDYVKGRKE